MHTALFIFLHVAYIITHLTSEEAGLAEGGGNFPKVPHLFFFQLGSFLCIDVILIPLNTHTTLALSICPPKRRQ